MSSKVKEKKDLKMLPRHFETITFFQENLSRIVTPYSSFFIVERKRDIYTGDEKLPFKQRHPTFRSLMKLEFQDALRNYERK